MQSFFKEFRDFAARGNVMDLAVGVIIGAAFGRIVDSAVNDLIMPIVAGLIGKPDFSQLYIALADPPGVPPTLEALKKAGVPIFAYGNFLTVLLNFILLALVVFIMIKQINRMKSKTPPPPPPVPAEDVLLLREIRDALKRS